MKFKRVSVSKGVQDTGSDSIQKPIVSNLGFVFALELITISCILALHVFIFTENGTPFYSLNIFFSILFLIILLASQIVIFNIIYYEMLFRRIIRKSIQEKFRYDNKIVMEGIKDLLKEKNYSIRILSEKQLFHEAYIPWPVRPVSEIYKIIDLNAYVIVKDSSDVEFGPNTQVIIGPIRQKNETIILDIERKIRKKIDIENQNVQKYI